MTHNPPTAVARRTLGAVVIVAAAAAAAICADEKSIHRDVKTPWGHIYRCTPLGDRPMVHVDPKHWPAGDVLELPTPFDNITSAHLDFPERGGRPITFEFNADATQIKLHLPENGSPAAPAGTGARIAVLETAEKTTQYEDGRIVFSALDATVHGTAARLETNPGNHRIGFWTNADDTVTWDYTATRWGMYDVELTYANDGGDGTAVSVDIGGASVDGAIKSTGSWYRYTSVVLGRLKLEHAGKQTLRVRCTKKTGPSVMNLKAVTLRPACEGSPPVQKDDGSILLHARDATIRGVMVRWEPKIQKQTVGYWANPSDQVYWEFTVTKPGTFDVAILQGCGKGQGGSEVYMKVTHGPGPPQPGVLAKGPSLHFNVVDTGGWQNFLARTVGTMTIDAPGRYTLSVRPTKKPGAAVMDLRQVTLTPVK